MIPTSPELEVRKRLKMLKKKKAPRKKAAKPQAGKAVKNSITRKQADLNREAARLIREAQREMVKQAVARLAAETPQE
jgi:hypothetical protein